MCEVAPHSTPTYPSLSVIFSRAFIHSNQQSIRVRPAHSGVAPAANISAGMTRLSHFWPHKHHFCHISGLASTISDATAATTHVYHTMPLPPVEFLHKCVLTELAFFFGEDRVKLEFYCTHFQGPFKISCLPFSEKVTNMLFRSPLCL